MTKAEDEIVTVGTPAPKIADVSPRERLAEEIMAPGDVQSFLDATGLTWDAAAAQLGLSRRTVGYYAKGAAIPRYVALACAYLRSTQHGRTFVPLEEPS